MEQIVAHQNHEQANDNELEGGNSGKSSSSYLCRQSSTRWSPTSEQIRILKDLYYNNGVRSPTAEQIQRISAKLRQYGKIEGKNVFYWFQNHKARERQKKRFTTSDIIRPPPPLLPNSKYHHHHHHHQDHQIISPPLHPPSSYCNKFSGNQPAGANFTSSSSSPGLLTVGNYGYGSVAMEKSFRECSITPSSSGGSMGQHHNFTWIGVDPYSSSPYPFTDDQRRKYTTINNIGVDQTLGMEEEEEEEEIETLPLFPMHGGIKQVQEATTDYNNYLNAIPNSAPGSRASLELTLNSYAARFPATY
ncbi:hypothetical protein OROMI_004712 [Orobanche minor]